MHAGDIGHTARNDEARPPIKQLRLADWRQAPHIIVLATIRAYAYFFIEKKVGAERTRIWTVTLAPQNKL